MNCDFPSAGQNPIEEPSEISKKQNLVSIRIFFKYYFCQGYRNESDNRP